MSCQPNSREKSTPRSQSLSSRIREGWLLAAFRNRQQHRHAMAIVFIRLSVNVRQVALFQLDRNENVSRRGNRKDQMADCHPRRRPKRYDKTEHDRMANDFVEHG